VTARGLARYSSMTGRTSSNGQRVARHPSVKNAPPVPPSPAVSVFSVISGNNIKLKCHYHDTRLFMIDSELTFQEMKQRIQDKFGVPSIQIKFMDEDTELVRMVDDEDLQLAKDLQRQKDGRMARLELWLFDG
jgi:hypothetical protein